MSINLPYKTKVTPTGDSITIVEPTAVDEIMHRGCAYPDITNIIFNVADGHTKAKRDENGELVIDPQTNKPVRETVRTDKILATTIYFADGSKVTVENSENDLIVDAEGKIVPEAYERGVIYALAKRFFSNYDKDENGKTVLVSEGFGRKLKELVSMAYNQQTAMIERKAAKETARAEHVRKQLEAKPKRKRESLAATVDRLSETVENLTKMVAALQSAQSQQISVEG